MFKQILAFIAFWVALNDSNPNTVYHVIGILIVIGLYDVVAQLEDFKMTIKVEHTKGESK